MARLGKKIDGGWYTVEIAEERVEDGQLIVTLDAQTYTVNRKDRRYWWAMVRTVAYRIRHGKWAGE